MVETSIAIVGAGLMGRTLALDLSRRGSRVTLFDRDDKDGLSSCASTGAGMLAPISELETSDELIFRLGLNSFDRWSELLRDCKEHVFRQNTGTIVVAHPLDASLIVEFQQRIISKLSDTRQPLSSIRELDARELAEFEPDLTGRFAKALFIQGEGQIDNRQLLSAIRYELEYRCVDWMSSVCAEVAPHTVTVENTKNEFSLVRDSSLSHESALVHSSSRVHEFSLVIDCRGLSAKNDLPTLRPVRGELIVVSAPEVKLSRPIRFIHPRFPIYIVPRQNSKYLIGATSFESGDMRGVTVQSAFELLSAAVSLHSGFAQAEIVELRSNRRPAFFDNSPRIVHSPGLIRINGLYRHGFLIAPELSRLVCEFVQDRNIDPMFSRVFVAADRVFENHAISQQISSSATYKAPLSHRCEHSTHQPSDQASRTRGLNQGQL